MCVNWTRLPHMLPGSVIGMCYQIVTGNSLIDVSFDSLGPLDHLFQLMSSVLYHCCGRMVRSFSSTYSSTTVFVLYCRTGVGRKCFVLVALTVRDGPHCQLPTNVTGGFLSLQSVDALRHASQLFQCVRGGTYLVLGTSTTY